MSNGIGAQVALLDWVLPGMSGIELLGALRQRGIELHSDKVLHPVTARVLWRQQESRGVEDALYAPEARRDALRRRRVPAARRRGGSPFIATSAAPFGTALTCASGSGSTMSSSCWRSMPATSSAIGQSMMRCAGRDSYRAVVSKVIALTSARHSNACATSFVPSIRTLTRSKAIRRSATAGTPAATDSLGSTPAASNEL
jgi:CheY-like chemotaxis protein